MALEPPLSADDLARLERVVRRLRAESRAVLDWLPPHERGARAVGRRLGVDRSTCQRLINLVRAEGGAAAAAEAPGAEGLRELAGALERADAPASLVAGVETAAEQFRQVVESLGGSQAGLLRRLRATDPTAGASAGAEDESRRRAMFDTAAAMTGSWAQTRALLVAIRLKPGDPERLELANIGGYLGYRSAPGGLPLVLGGWHEWRGKSEPEPLPESGLDAEPAEGRVVTSLLPEFTSQPAPVVTARASGGRLAQVVDSAAAVAAPVDIALGYKLDGGTHPRLHSAPFIRQKYHVGLPVRAVVFDVWLERPLAQASVASLAAYRTSPVAPPQIRDRWFDRFADHVRLELLPSPDRAATPLHDRHDELTRLAFERLHWPPTAFTGFRCALSYPLWGAEYAMLFDFGQQADNGD